MGMKATVRVPSASSRRSTLGMVKATKKASVTALANSAATTMSRTRPRTRLARVSSPTQPAARTMRRLPPSPLGAFSSVSVELAPSSSEPSGPASPETGGLGSEAVGVLDMVGPIC